MIKNKTILITGGTGSFGRRAIFLFDSQDGKSNERLAKRFTDFLYKQKQDGNY